MVDRMVKEQMPKSSVEYVLRKGMEGSLFGFADSMMRSPLQQEIDARGEAAYNPSTGEKWAGRGVSFAADAVAPVASHRGQHWREQRVWRPPLMGWIGI